MLLFQVRQQALRSKASDPLRTACARHVNSVQATYHMTLGWQNEKSLCGLTTADIRITQIVTLVLGVVFIFPTKNGIETP